MCVRAVATAAASTIIVLALWLCYQKCDDVACLHRLHNMRTDSSVLRTHLHEH
jgi:hypothetical protein